MVDVLQQNHNNLISDNLPIFANFWMEERLRTSVICSFHGVRVAFDHCCSCSVIDVIEVDSLVFL